MSGATKKAIEIAVAQGDGIGKEIMAACLKVFEAAKVPLVYHHVEMGKEVYLKGLSTGMTPEAKETVERLGILFKGPMETPKGTGVKSINVTARKVWSTFANKRTFKTIPGVNTIFAKAGIPIDLTLIRENIEDTYGGIEHMQSHDVAQCRRLITRPGCEQVHRYALKMARAKGARRVTCAHKANIMKITDGLFLETFYKIAKQEFPDVKVDDAIIDDMAMKLVSRPDAFDMIVLPNLQGDILSDLCAGLVGGLGLAPSANIGDHISIFEAVHGTAPDIAGKNLANPTALLLSGLTMLRHLDMNSKAKRIEEGLLTTLNLGFRTRDVASAADKVVSTSQFADEIIKNMPNEVPEPKAASAAKPFVPPSVPKNHIMMKTPRDISKETVVGVDIFVDTSLTPNELAPLLQKSIGNTPVSLIMLSNRGTQVWPSGSLFTECVNHYRARFQTKNNAPIAPNELLQLAARVNDVAGNVSVARVCSLEMLLKIGDKLGFTLAQVLSMNSSKRPLLQYHFDITSPYAYLGFVILQRYNKKNLWASHVDIEFVPMYLAGIMKISSNAPPVTNPLKGKWLVRDLKYSSKMYKIKMTGIPTVGFPMNTIKTMRLLTVIHDRESKQVYEECILQLFEGYWLQNLNVSDETVLKEIISKVVSQEKAEEYISGINSDTVKDKLLKVTTDLVEKRKAFGAPWIVATKSDGASECFFGSDRFETVAFFLGLDFYGNNPDVKAKI